MMCRVSSPSNLNYARPVCHAFSRQVNFSQCDDGGGEEEGAEAEGAGAEVTNAQEEEEEKEEKEEGRGGTYSKMTSACL